MLTKGHEVERNVYFPSAFAGVPGEVGAPPMAKQRKRQGAPTLLAPGWHMSARSAFRLRWPRGARAWAWWPIPLQALTALRPTGC